MKIPDVYIVVIDDNRKKIICSFWTSWQEAEDEISKLKEKPFYQSTKFEVVTLEFFAALEFERGYLAGITEATKK